MNVNYEITKEDIKSTIKNMKASGEVKRALQKACDKDDHGAIFYVHGLIIRGK